MANKIMVSPNADTKMREEIREALRCSASTDPVRQCKKEQCRYYIKCREEDKTSWEEKHPDMPLSDDFFEGCDCDQMALDAADLLEEKEPTLYGNVLYLCGECGSSFVTFNHEKMNYCPNCGRKVKW